MELVNSGAYNNNKIHRVYKDFVIQGGKDKDNVKESIKGEFDANGISNDISHVRGTVSMARMGDYSSGFDTASTEFFIVIDDSLSLDHYYAGFGSVTKGMDVVDKIASKVKNVDEAGMINDTKDMPIIEYIKVVEK
jgi:peptidyl-prolyl cis-trans isomerase B (cyclophilin B)